MVPQTRRARRRAADPGPKRGTRERAGAPSVAPSVASIVHRDLRAEIVSLVRRPGSPLDEAEIARGYGASRTPVREAILRLADEGLIEVFPRSGTFVAPIPLARLPEAIAIRRALEDVVVRDAARRVTPEGLASLRAVTERQRCCETRGDHEGFHQADEDFHATLAEIADRRGFWALVLQVKTEVDRFRRSTLLLAGRMGAVIAEHDDIVEALGRHDVDAAAASLGAHLDALLRAVAEASDGKEPVLA